MKKCCAASILCLLLTAGAQAFIYTDWAYHNDGREMAELIPGRSDFFRPEQNKTVSKEQPVQLFLLTPYDYAGEKEEKIRLRWWNGEKEHWLDAEWVDNVVLSAQADPVQTFHGQPERDDMLLDVWKVTVPASMIHAGSNYYVFQMIGTDPKGLRNEAVILSRLPGDAPGECNILGQYLIRNGSFFGKDWVIVAE